MPSPDWLPEGAVEEQLNGVVIEPADVLYEFDGPRIFTSRDGFWTYLWYLCDESNDTLRYLSVPTNEDMLDRLLTGVITVHEAISAPGARLVDLSNDFHVQRSWKIVLAIVPERFLPKKHTMLYAHLEPLLNVKLSGAALKAGHVPASAVKRGVDGAYLALKKLAEATVSSLSSVGRPARSARRLFDLPTQRLAFGSIELAFANHHSAQGELIDDRETKESLASMGQMLSDGLKWVSNPHSEGTHRPNLAVLEALEKLSPPLDGVIEQVSIRGGLLPKRREYSLNRSASRTIKFAIREAKREENERIVVVTGFIREFDIDKQSFIIRDDNGNDLGVFICDEDAYEDAYAAFSEQMQVQVLGRRLRGRSYAEAEIVAPVSGPDPSDGEDAEPDRGAG